MLISYLVWVLIGALLGMLYTWCIQLEIENAQKNNIKIGIRNSLFSVIRIGFCCLVLFIAFRYHLYYGLTCLLAFLFSKNVTLIRMVRKNQKIDKFKQ